MTSPFLARALCLACASLAWAPAPSAAQSVRLDPPRGSAYASLGEDELAFRLSLGDASPARGYSLGLGLDGDAGGAAISGYFSLGSLGEAGPGNAMPQGIAAGPGSVSGAARILLDPTSPTALASGSPVELDRSLQSRCAVLGLRSGPLSLFAAAEGRGAVALATKGGVEARKLGAAAAGLSLGWPLADGLELQGLAALSCGGASAPASSGWRPDPSASPAINAGDDEARLSAALLAQSRRSTGASLFALVGSYGRLSGPGLAFRLESRENAGPFSLRLAAGTAGPAFRELAGPRQERLLAARAEARLAMRRASSLSASVEAEAAGESILYAPIWGKKASLRLILPAGAEDGRFIDTRLDAERPGRGAGASGSAGGCWSLALARKAEAGGRSGSATGGAKPASSSMRLGYELRWDSRVAGLELSLETELAGEGGLPSLGLDLSVDLLEEGEADSPALATGGARLRFPFGEGASLELRAALPEAGVILAPASGGGQAASPAFSLRYRASI
jgi:hypothetical protein